MIFLGMSANRNETPSVLWAIAMAILTIVAVGFWIMATGWADKR